VQILQKVFRLRTCEDSVFKNRSRPCLLHQIHRCSAPCVGKIDESGHRDLVLQLVSFMSGNSKEIMTDIAKRMNDASSAQDYEQASVLRDDLAALERVLEKSVVVLPDDTFADIIGLHHDDLQSAVQVFSVRSGRIVGQRGFIMENPVDATSETLMTDALMHIYANSTKEEIPTEVLVSHEPESALSLAELLGTIREAQISVRVPARGDKRMLMETVVVNAGQALGLHKTKRSTDLVTRSKALAEIQQAVGLSDAPLRIECIDVSHISGTNVVASLVVFEDGIPKKKEYRQFIIEDPRDDTASIAQVVARRFKEHDEKRPYRPNLLVIDGGLPQVNAAAKALELAGVGNMHVIGLAKRMEEIWKPGAPYPVILPRNSEALFMLQRVRDEAHRFAITLHRNRRSKGMVDSVLDEVPGLGPIKKKAVLAHFGSLKRVAAATVAELAEVPGIGPVQAEQIWQFLNQENPVDVSVNTATGEIIES
jgi:excinuclease ABC subunit C